MINPLFGCDDRVAEFVASNLEGCARGFGEARSIGFCRDGDLVAGFVYHNWNPEAKVIEVSGYSNERHWVNQERLNIIFNYPFEGVGCQLVVARHCVKNARVRRIWRALGADEYIIPHLRGENKAEAISTLTAENWRNSKFSKGNPNVKT